MKRTRASTGSSNCYLGPTPSFDDIPMDHSSHTSTKASGRPSRPSISITPPSDTKPDRRCQESRKERKLQKPGTSCTSDKASSSRDDDKTSTASSADAVLRIPACMLQSSSPCHDILLDATYDPPCTSDTLRELDLHAIQHNLNLRVDLCYDHDLFFQPISGRKGETKRIESDKYWLSLADELRIYAHDASGVCQCHSFASSSDVFFKPRLPLMFKHLEKIVEMLVPEVEHAQVASQLNPDFLMQQVRHGVFDIVRLSEWMAALLTTHCAPKRDDLAREITVIIRAGAEQADMTMIVAGIEKLFDLLEAMKLDVANHQIRAFRYHLIEDTIPFQRDYFSKAIENKSLDISRSQRWFRQAQTKHNDVCNQSTDLSITGFHALLHGLTRLCDPAIKRVPNTLQHDYHRFVRLQEDLQDLVQLELCLQVFEQRVFELDASITRRQVMSVHPDLKSRIISLTEDKDGNGGAISDHLDAVSFEITRAACSLVAQTQGVPGEDGQMIHDFEFERTNKALYEYFQAEDDEEIVTSSFLSMLEDRTLQFGQQFLAMSTLKLSNEQRQWALARNKANARKLVVLPDWDDMARRLAHVGAVHWKIWADLCYLKDDEDDNMTDLISPVSVYGDIEFYHPDASEPYSPFNFPSSTASSPTTSSLILGFESPLASPHPYMNSEFQKGLAAMQTPKNITLCPHSKDAAGGFENGVVVIDGDTIMDFIEDSTATMGSHRLDPPEFDMDTSATGMSHQGASAHLRKGNVRRKSL